MTTLTLAIRSHEDKHDIANQISSPVTYVLITHSDLVVNNKLHLLTKGADIQHIGFKLTLEQLRTKDGVDISCRSVK